jgi:hypothetical protein
MGVCVCVGACLCAVASTAVSFYTTSYFLNEYMEQTDDIIAK